jgi:outer membrane receptor protein involved in Fe transport
MLSVCTKAQFATGTVCSTTGDTLAFAQVELIDLFLGQTVNAVYTDDKGYFKIPISQAEIHYKIRISSLGYLIHLTDSFLNSLDLGVVKLSLDGNEIGETVIKIDKNIIEKTGRGMNINIASSPLLENSNAKEILSKIPGVTMDENGKITLNGQREVQIFVNGKPSLISLDQLIQQLESTPGSEIEKIEVFNNPPAKFDAEGSGGVINIVKKTNNSEGFNGNIGVNAGAGKYPKANSWSSFNFRKKKINFYGNLNASQNKITFIQKINLSTQINDKYSQINNLKIPVFTNRNLNGKVGMDFKIDSNSTLGVLISPYSGDFKAYEITNTTVIAGDYNHDLTKGYRDFDFDWKGNVYNLNYGRKIKEGSWNFDVDYLYNYNGSDQLSKSDYWLENEVNETEEYTTDWNIYLRALTGKLDFEKKLKKGWALNAGGKFSILKLNNQTKNSFLNSESNWAITSNAAYKESIQAAYVSTDKKWGKKWNSDFGLRAENTIISGGFGDDSTNFNRQFLNLFPNASVSYEANAKWSHSLSYSKRISRPEYQELTPFEQRMNPYLISKGNSYLKPELSHSFNYGLALLNRYFLSVGHTYKTDGIFLTPNHTSESIVQTYQLKNIGQQHNSNITLSAPLKLRKWWTINSSLTVFRNQLLNAGKLNFAFNSFNTRLQNQFKFKKGWNAEFVGFYHYKGFWNVWYQDPFIQFDFSVSKKMNSWKFAFTGNDIFGLRIHTGGQFQGLVESETSFEPEKQVFKVSASYSFGNQKLKKQRNRETSASELNNRTKK